MKFWEKSKPSKLVDNTETLRNDFKLRGPFWGYRSIDYREYEPFVNLTPVIDEYLNRQFEGDIDWGNANTLNNLIFGMAREAEQDLDRQHIDHGDRIQDLEQRNQSDRKHFEMVLAGLREDMQRNERDLRDIETRLAQDKFMVRRQKNA